MLVLAGSLTGSPVDTTKPIHLSGHAQGTTWHITYYQTDSTALPGHADSTPLSSHMENTTLSTQVGSVQSTHVGSVLSTQVGSILPRQIDSILDKIDSSLSLYKPYSLVCQFNRSDKAIRMDEHLQHVVVASLDTWRQTNGDFDVTVQPLVEAWGFSAHRQDQYPDSARIRQLLTCVGSEQLSINGDILVKSKPCIRIDPDGIAQGYSVDVLADFLELHGINNYIVELGGELRVRGGKHIGIEAPNEDAFQQPVMQKILYVNRGAITTSGNYRAFHERGGKKFSHTIDPHTGFPSDNELISVTVYASNAITADAYDNVFVLMGLERSIQFINKRKDLSAFFIYRKKDGSIATYSTKSFNALLQP